MILRITICITTVGCGCCISIVTVSARQRNSYLRESISHFPVVFSPTSDYIVRPSFTTVSTTNNNHDFNSSSIYPGCQRDSFHARFSVSAVGRRRVARNISEATDRRTGEKNFGTQGIKDLKASSKANLHSSGLHECS